MAESIRLHHPTFANVNYAVETPLEMPLGARPCNACSAPGAPVTHRNKTVHLRLDPNGDVFVSRQVFELLQKVPTMAGLEVVEGRNAPPQQVGAVALPTQEIILAERRFYVPGRTKYESRDKMLKPFQPTFDKMIEDVDRKETAKKAEKSSTFILGKKRDN